MKPEQMIMQKLDQIEKEVREIREHMVDADTILTAEERRLLDESVKHEKEGKLAPLEEVEHARHQAG